MTTRAPNFFRRPVEAEHRLQPRLSLRSSVASPIRPPRANRTTSTSSGPKITFQCSVRPDSHSSISRIGGAPRIAPLQRAEAAEQHHDDQFARALPGHIGGADELGWHWRAGTRPGRRACRRSRKPRVGSGRRRSRSPPCGPRFPSRRAGRGRSARRRARGKKDKRRADRRRRRSRTRVRSGAAANAERACCGLPGEAVVAPVGASELAVKNAICPNASVIMMK